MYLLATKRSSFSELSLSCLSIVWGVRHQRRQPLLLAIQWLKFAGVWAWTAGVWKHLRIAYFRVAFQEFLHGFGNLCSLFVELAHSSFPGCHPKTTSHTDIHMQRSQRTYKIALSTLQHSSLFVTSYVAALEHRSSSDFENSFTPLQPFTKIIRELWQRSTEHSERDSESWILYITSSKSWSAGDVRNLVFFAHIYRAVPDFEHLVCFANQNFPAMLFPSAIFWLGELHIVGATEFRI